MSWRILLEDLISLGPNTRGRVVLLPVGGTSFRPVGLAAGRAGTHCGGGGAAGGVAADRGDARAIGGHDPAVDTFVTAGHLSVALDSETTRLLLGGGRVAFMPGWRHRLIGFGLAWAEFLGAGGGPIGIDVEGHGREEELATDVDLSHTVGWFTTKYPVSLAVGGLSWAQLMAGEAVVGGGQGRQRAASGRTRRADLRGAALPEHRFELSGSDPAIGFNYLGRLGAAGRPRGSSGVATGGLGPAV